MWIVSVVLTLGHPLYCVRSPCRLSNALDLSSPSEQDCDAFISKHTKGRVRHSHPISDFWNHASDASERSSVEDSEEDTNSRMQSPASSRRMSGHPHSRRSSLDADAAPLSPSYREPSYTSLASSQYSINPLGQPSSSRFVNRAPLPHVSEARRYSQSARRRMSTTSSETEGDITPAPSIRYADSAPNSPRMSILEGSLGRNRGRQRPSAMGIATPRTASGTGYGSTDPHLLTTHVHPSDDPNSHMKDRLRSPMRVRARSAYEPGTPSKSLMKRLKHTASMVGIGGSADTYDAVDHEEEEEIEEAERANGERVWYSSYVTIDWIHDAIKDSIRVRRLRHNASKSIRGWLVNCNDRFQGWLIVTIVGFLSACIALLIIRIEMALFDLKEGYCSTSWGSAKRFCCGTPSRRDDGEMECADWVEWGSSANPRVSSFAAYMTIATALATISSTMTIYLSSSALHTTSKDSIIASVPKAENKARASSPQSEETDRLLPLPSEPQQPAEPPRKVMYFAAGSGIPEIKTILSGFVIHGYLGGWTLLTKSVGLALSVASGLSLGKEGPLVHIASCVGNIVSRGFSKYETNEAKRREILSAASAAGVAVAFGAPVGGVLFALEEVSYFFPPKVMWRSFWCAAVAAMTLKFLNPFGNGSIVLFAVTYTKEYHYWEFPIFLLLGIFGGVYGAVFSRLNIIWSRRVRNATWIKRHPIVEVLMVTIITTLVSYSHPFMRMGGTELVANLFVECGKHSESPLCVDRPADVARVVTAIGYVLLAKGALTIVTFGVKLPAGIFIPSLAVGACFGRIVGLCMEYIEYNNPQLAIFDVCKNTDCVLPGLYSMVGAAASLAGVTRTTVSLAVIMFELTGTLSYVVPVMFSVLVAKTVADSLEKKGIYDLVIDLNQLPYLDAKSEYLWGGHSVSEVADRRAMIIRGDKGHTVATLTAKMHKLIELGLGDTGFPVLVKEESLPGSMAAPPSAQASNRNGLRVVGFLGLNELAHALSILSDEPDAPLNLIPDDSRSRSSVASVVSYAGSSVEHRNPYDLTRYLDQAPITVQPHSSLELVQQLFVKLGARQIFVVDARGQWKGVIYKKDWLRFLNEIETHAE